MALDGTLWKIADAAALVAAVDRELGDVTGADKELVAKGRLDQREADWRRGLIGDIRADLLFHFAPLSPGELYDAHGRGDPAVPWTSKVRWIERELEDRNRDYPDRVAKGRMTQADADRRIGAIAELRRLYWNGMFMWEPPEGPARDYLRALRAAQRIDQNGRLHYAIDKTEGEKIYREHVRSHMAALEAESGASQGRLVA